MQAVGFTSVCSTWCRGRGQSGAVISWYAAVRNEARARRMMLRGDDFWQFASNTGRLVEPGLQYLRKSGIPYKTLVYLNIWPTE